MDDLLSPFVLIASIVRNRHHAFHSPEARPGALAALQRKEGSLQLALVLGDR